MSADWVQQVLRVSEVKGTQRVILMILAWHANDAGVAWPKVPVLAAEAGVSERAAQYALRQLERGGWLGSETVHGHPTRYHLLQGGAADCTPAVNCTPQVVQEVAPQVVQEVAPQVVQGVQWVAPQVVQGVQEVAPPVNLGGAAHCTSEVQPTAPIKEEKRTTVVELRTQPQRDDTPNTDDTVSRGIPLHVKQHTLAFVTSPDEQARWTWAWGEVHTLAREWDPLAHLSKYLAKCRRQGRTVTPEDWLVWFTEDEQDARAKARERAEQGDYEDLWEKQLREDQRRQRQEQGR